jgi:hypothetical protein
LILKLLARHEKMMASPSRLVDLRGKCEGIADSPQSQ